MPLRHAHRRELCFSVHCPSKRKLSCSRRVDLTTLKYYPAVLREPPRTPVCDDERRRRIFDITAGTPPSVLQTMHAAQYLLRMLVVTHTPETVSISKVGDSMSGRPP